MNKHIRVLELTLFHYSMQEEDIVENTNANHPIRPFANSVRDTEYYEWCR